MKEQNTESTKIPTKEEMIAAMKEQIEFKQVQCKLQELNMRLAEDRARELEAIVKMEQFTPKEGEGNTKDDMVEHTITKENLNNNPEMVEAGLLEGQKIGIPKAMYEQWIAQQAELGKPKRKMEVVPD